jgi:hypothetical protein
MLQICIGSYIVLSLFTFLLLWGAIAKAPRSDKAVFQKSKQDKKVKEWAYFANLRLNS